MGDNYLLRHPKKQFFYKSSAILMTYLAIGNQEWWGYGPPMFPKSFFLNRLCSRIIAPSYLFSQIGYFYLHYHELPITIRGILFALIPVTWLGNAILLSAVRPSFVKVMKELMDKIHLHNYLYMNDHVKKIIIKTEKNTRRACGFMIFFLMSDWFAWSTITVYNNYRNWEYVQNKTTRFETIMYIILPFDYEYDFNCWLLVHISNIYIVGCGCLLILLHNCMNYMFVFQIIGHIKNLKYKLKNDFKGDFNDEETREKLVDVIKYHSFVLGKPSKKNQSRSPAHAALSSQEIIYRDIQAAFSVNVTAFYFYNLIADSLLLYQLMVGERSNSMIYGLMIIAYLGGLIVMSFVLEEVRRQSDGLSDLVYHLPWERMSISNRKMLLLLLMRIQPVLVFTGAGGLETGVRPMISIIKSTFSYYVMLKSSMKT